jgi:hypothetical protein
VKRQPRLLDGGKRKAPLIAALISYDHNFLADIPVDTSDLNFVGATACRIARHIGGDYRAAADKPSPIFRAPKRPFETRRRHFQNVSLAAKVFGVQLLLDRARCSRAIIDRDLCTVFPLDTNVDDRTTFAASNLQLEKL